MFGLISLEVNRKKNGVGQSLSETRMLNTQDQPSLKQAEETMSASSNTPTQGSFVEQLAKTFSRMTQTLASDFQIIFDRDPAARNWLEVLCCYPGLHALVLHRLSHRLYHQKIPFIPRFLSHLGRFFTGIEIHPGATIGRGVFIDHGMGVVIGETAIIGDYCLIYQNVTLGGTGKETGKRHPTLGSHVVVGTGAKVLGNISIGNHVRIGAGSIVLRNVPSDCTVVGVPGRIISKGDLLGSALGDRSCPLEHGKLPDVEASVIRSLLYRIEQLEQKLNSIDTESNAVKKKQKYESSSLERIFADSIDSQKEFLVCELPTVTNQNEEPALDPDAFFCSFPDSGNGELYDYLRSQQTE